MHLVYMAGSHLSDPCDDASTPQGGRRMGLPKYKRQMQDAAVQSDSDDGVTGRNSDFGLHVQLGPHSTSGEPP